MNIREKEIAASPMIRMAAGTVGQENDHRRQVEEISADDGGLAPCLSAEPFWEPEGPAFNVANQAIPPDVTIRPSAPSQPAEAQLALTNGLRFGRFV
jgi:hypothetical protein